MAERVNLKGLTVQQIDIICELQDREYDGRGAQTALDFEGFPTGSPWSDRKHPISQSAARSTLERLVKRGLVERVAERPRTYRLTASGKESILHV